MFKRPTSRRRTKNEEIILNLVPVLDTLVTLIGFLLFTMAFFNVVHIESPFPQASSEQMQEKLKEKPLQLTVTLRENEIEIWSPFELIQAKHIPTPQPNQPDLHALHNALIEIKQKFVTETKVVIVPYQTANYDLLITVMDAMRLMDKSDPPLFMKNPATGNDEAVKTLFPDIIFGNLLGDV